MQTYPLTVIKSMNNGVTLNFHARAPVRFKKSVVRSFVNRIYNSSSNWKYFHEGMVEAKRFCKPVNPNHPIQNHFMNRLFTKLLRISSSRNKAWLKRLMILKLWARSYSFSSTVGVSWPNLCPDCERLEHRLNLYRRYWKHDIPS